MNKAWFYKIAFPFDCLDMNKVFNKRTPKEKRHEKNITFVYREKPNLYSFLKFNK